MINKKSKVSTIQISLIFRFLWIFEDAFWRKSLRFWQILLTNWLKNDKNGKLTEVTRWWIVGGFPTRRCAPLTHQWCTNDVHQWAPMSTNDAHQWAPMMRTNVHQWCAIGAQQEFRRHNNWNKLWNQKARGQIKWCTLKWFRHSFW